MDRLSRRFLLSAFMLGSMAATGLNAQHATGSYDPVTMDPPARDAVNPPGMVELALESGGQRLNALLYVASGAAPRPTVVMLHGNPGNERNLDIAQAIRRAGANVLYFDYRGNWGSGGTFSRSNALEDVAAVLKYVRSKEVVDRYRADPRRVALIGHSMGGFLGLMNAATDPAVSCVVGIDTTNDGATGRLLQSDREAEAKATAAANAYTGPGGPYRAESGAVLVAEMKAHADSWDLTKYAAPLSTRPLLFISAVNRDTQTTLAGALTKAGAQHLTTLTWDTDHSFSDRRIQLTRTILDWLHSDCGF